MGSDIYDLFRRMDYPTLVEFETNQQEENLFFDFKEKRDSSHPKPGNDDKKNLSKTLSAFSNASGGLLVWGVCARRDSNDEFSPDVVRSLKPISGINAFLTNINTLCSQALDPPNPGVESKKVMAPDSNDEGFLVTYVPAVDTPPCLALLGENRYYIRIDDTSQPMPHYILSDMFGRRPKPVLKLEYKIEAGAVFGDKVVCLIYVGIGNYGRAVARFPGMLLSGAPLIGPIHEYSEADWALNPVGLMHQSKFNGGFMWTGDSNYAIHPTTVLNVLRLERKIPRVAQQTGLELRLNYELYADTCLPVVDSIVISNTEIVRTLNL